MKKTIILFNKKVRHFQRAFRDNFITLMISSFGLLVALSWNSFWNAWVGSFKIEDTLPYKFYIAIAMTAMAVTLTYIFTELKKT